MDVKLSKDEKCFAIALYSNEIQVYETETAQMTALLDLNMQFKRKFITSIELNQEGNKITVMGNRNLLFFYDVQHRTVIDKLEMPINADYKNSKMKLNSAQIIDGYDMEEMEI